jgi:hypothetical protein
MATKTVFANVGEAKNFLADLSTKGFDLFRGQRKKFPTIKPSLFRTTGRERDAAEKRLSDFLTWCAKNWRLSIYRDVELKAIAQHYGIPTHLLDVTRSFDVALFFAQHDVPPVTSDLSVVYAWKASEIGASDEIGIIDVPVSNLWRLEAQQGLFLDSMSTSRWTQN